VSPLRRASRQSNGRDAAQKHAGSARTQAPLRRSRRRPGAAGRPPVPLRPELRLISPLRQDPRMSLLRSDALTVRQDYGQFELIAGNMDDDDLVEGIDAADLPLSVSQ
jgi:hypothetical protein